MGELGEHDKAVIAGKKKDEEYYTTAEYEFVDPQIQQEELKGKASKVRSTKTKQSQKSLLEKVSI